MPLSKIISIGDELLNGQVINSNAAFLGEKLSSIGMPVKKTVIIGDNEIDFMEELFDSMKNYDITVITGGLGPTHDDLTKSILVKFFDDELVLNENILENVKAIFKNRGIKMPDENKDQALVPKGCNIIWNPNGTAPGICYEKDGKFIIALPGVPYEIYPMVNNSVLPLLKEKFSDKFNIFYCSKTFLTAGIGESVLNEMLGDIRNIVGNDKLAFLPSAGSVRLRVDISAEDEEVASKRLKIIEARINDKIGKHIYGFNDDTLEKVIGKILTEKDLSISIAESCTGGSLSSRITDVSGSSTYFKGGIVAYSNESKINLLNVKSETIEKFGAVSEQTAIEMAINVREIFKTNISISITGIAGPDGGSEEKPVGLVYIGYSDDNKTFANKYYFPPKRERVKIWSQNLALEICRKILLGID